MFRAHALIIRRSKLHDTAYGIITPIGASSWLITEIKKNLISMTGYRFTAQHCTIVNNA